MTAARTLLEQVADWAIGVRAIDIPPRLMRAARAQLRSVIASVYAGAESPAATACRQAALALGTRGQATVLPGGERTAPYAAVLANAAASMAHDFDDYLFLGHTGHSAVLAALACGEEQNADLDSVLAAQVVANEVAGRLGAYVAVGPQNGQLWAHIHLAGAVVAAARLAGLDAETTADALGIAFYQPPFTLFPGFMASDAKVLTAAQPAASGLFAVELARRGMRGARSIVEQPRGFASQFAFVPVPEVMGGLGQAWVTDSLSCKIYPGCAYIDGPVDAALVARGERVLTADAIEAVDIEATALTTGMESIAEESAAADSLESITVNFSARRSVAIALLAGKLTPREVEGPWLGEHADDVRQVASRTRLRLSTGQTRDMLAGIGRAVSLGSVARAIGARRAWRARHQIGQAYASAATRRRSRGRPSARGGRQALDLLAGAVRGLAGARPLEMSEVDFRALEFRFSARVVVSLRGGGQLVGDCAIPIGAAGSGLDAIDRAMRRKLAEESAAVGDGEAADRIAELLAAPAGEVSAHQLTAAICARLRTSANA